MGKVAFHLSDSVVIDGLEILIQPDISAQDQSYQTGIIRSSGLQLALKSIMFPIFNARNHFLVDGFIERIIGKYIEKYFPQDPCILEIGCGDMNLRRFLPNNVYYNAFDVRLSEFQIRRQRNRQYLNLAVASCTDIPCDSEVANLLLATEVFEHIAEIETAIDEVYRVLRKGGVLLVSIPNNFCYKYIRKGKNIDHVNEWTWQGFIDFMEKHRLRFVEGKMCGWWIPLPTWVTKRTKTSYQLPISSLKEILNTNFFYVFKK